MWLLHFLPDSFILWIVNIVFLAGLAATIAGFFIKFIPFVNTYRLPIQVGGIVVLCLGIYLKGGYSVEMQWRERVADLEQQIQVAQGKSDQANKDLVAEREKKNKVIKEVQVVIQERIKQVAQQMDSTCKVDPAAISILNDAALNVKGAGK